MTTKIARPSTAKSGSVKIVGNFALKVMMKSLNQSNTHQRKSKPIVLNFV
jgi:hypothetical protein